MKFLLIVFFIIISLFSNSVKAQVSNQISEIDSILDKAFEMRWIDPYETIMLCSKALEMSISSNYISGILKSYSFSGVGYENLTMYEEALNNYLTGLRIADSLNLDEEIGHSYNNLASCYINLEKYDIAFDYLKKGLEKAEKVKSDNLLAYIYRNLSIYYRRMKQSEKAIPFAKKSLELREKNKDKRGIITSMRELLVAYYDLKDFDNANKVLNKLYSIIGNNPKHNLQLARIKRTEGEMLRDKGKYDEALKAFNESAEIFKSIGNLDGLIGVTKLKSELNYLVGKYNQAYKELLEHNSYVDSLNKIRSLQKISLIENQFKNKELLNKLNVVSQEVQQKNIILIALFIGFLILGFSFYLTSKAYKEKRKLISQITEQNKLLEEDNVNKQKMLSVIGHDLKNPLGSVYSITENLVNNYQSIDKDELNHYLIVVNKAVKNALNLLDNLLIWSMNKMGKLRYNLTDIRIKDVVEKSIDLYMHFVKEKNLNIKADIQDTYVYADSNTLDAIIRNLINNAIKFSKVGGTVKIISESSDNFIRLKFTNKGKGLTEDQIYRILNDEQNFTNVTNKKSSTGLGLQIVKDFIKINKGELFIKSTPNEETEFSITLPKSKNIQ